MSFADTLTSILGMRGNPLPSIDTTPAPPMQVRKEAIPFHKLAALGGMGEQQNLSQTLSLSTLNAAFRQAERGDPWQLFTIFRDALSGGGHIQALWAQRKMAITAEVQTLLPARKGNLDDQKAVDICQQMIDGCENWTSGLNHLLDAFCYPLSVAEKMFAPASGNEDIRVQYILKRFEPVNYLLIHFRLPFMTSSALPNGDFWNPNDWEADLRFYAVKNGVADRSTSNWYKAMPSQHIIHRGSTISTSIRDGFGGMMKALLYSWFFSTQGRDYYNTALESYGLPIPIIKADTQNAETMNTLRKAFQDFLKRRAVFINAGDATGVEYQQANTQDMAKAYELWLNYHRGEMTRLILGQELSFESHATGLGSGVSDLQGQVRSDIKQYDRIRLAQSLRTQLFEQYLRINGCSGKAPKIIWGGIDYTEAQALGATVKSYSDAGLEPTDDSLDYLGEKTGITWKRKAASASKPVPGVDLPPQNADEKPSDTQEKPVEDKVS